MPFWYLLFILSLCVSLLMYICVYMHTEIHSIYLNMHVYIRTHIFGYTWTEQIWVSNSYYSLSIAQNKNTTWFNFLFLPSFVCLRTFACVHVCTNKKLATAVFVHSCLWLNWMGLRVKRTVTNPGDHPRPFRLLNVNRIILKSIKKIKKKKKSLVSMKTRAWSLFLNKYFHFCMGFHLGFLILPTFSALYSSLHVQNLANHVTECAT